MRLGFAGNCALGVCSFACVFYFYIFLVCALSPDRFHIKKHREEEEDRALHFTAWSSAAVACFLYGCAAALLWALRLTGGGGGGELLAFCRAASQNEIPGSTYELESLTPKTHRAAGEL